MTADRKAHLAAQLTAWLNVQPRAPYEVDLWIDCQVAIGLMSEVEAHEFERCLGGVQ
jgi:hypothetical protein